MLFLKNRRLIAKTYAILMAWVMNDKRINNSWIHSALPGYARFPNIIAKTPTKEMIGGEYGAPKSIAAANNEEQK
jgi:hypothetical protein